MNLLNIIKSILNKGIRIGYSSGKPFDPRDQKRTDGMQDIIKSKNKRRKNKK